MVDLHKIFHHHFGNSGKGKKKKKKNTFRATRGCSSQYRKRYMISMEEKNRPRSLVLELVAVLLIRSNTLRARQ